MKVLAVVICTFLASHSFAGTPKVASKTSSTASSTVEFVEGEEGLTFKAVGHPSALNVNGVGPKPKGTLQLVDGKLTGDLSMDMTKLTAGMSLRTNHMKEKVFEVETYPEAKLTFTELKLIAGAESLPFRGNLLFHGVTKPVEGKMKIVRKEDDFEVHADFEVKLTDFNIKPPAFAGITIEDKVSITIDTQAKMKKLE